MSETRLVAAPAEHRESFGTGWLAVYGKADPGSLGGRFRSAGPGRSSHDGPALRLFGESELPMPSVAEEGRLSVLFDGTLDNREELAADAGLPPDREAGAAELILRAYRRYGEEAVARARGTFAILVWDGERETLLCARDQAGLHPLYHARAGGDVVVSSSIESLLAHPRVSAAPNRLALADHICHRWPILDETYFESVRRVPPGHVLRVDPGGERSYRYWNPPGPDFGASSVPEEQIAQFEELFTRSVRRAFDNGPVGIFLSGGLDSVSVAAVATDISNAAGHPRPQALSLHFTDDGCDEEVSQRGVARSLGLSQVMINFWEAVGPRGLMAAALEESRSRQQPLLNIWAPAYDRLGREGRQLGCRTILTGAGGDEWLCVSPFYAADLLRRLDFAGIYRLWNAGRRSHRHSSLRMLKYAFWTFSARALLGVAGRRAMRAYAPGLWRARARRAASIPDWVAPDPELRGELLRRGEQKFEQLYWGEGSYYEHDIRLSLDHPLVSMENEETFVNARKLGVQIHQPFLDVDITNFLSRMIPEVLNHGGRSKGMVRRMVDRRFPDLGYNSHKKVSAMDFYRNTLLKEGPEAWREAQSASALDALGVVDARKLHSTLERTFAYNVAATAYHVWDVLDLEVWVRARL